MDDRNLRSLQDLTRPSLFPDIMWHSSGRPWRNEEEAKEIKQTKRSASSIYLIRKSREIHMQMQESVYFVRPQTEVDIVRYRKRPRTSELSCDRAILEHMGKNVANSSHVPEELLQRRTKKTAKASAKTKSGDLSIDDIAAKVKNEIEGEGEDDEQIVDQVEDEDEEDDGEDYVRDYYQSEDESAGGGDDGEPTF